MVNLGGTQKVDFLGTCFGGEGLGLNSWAMISFMGRRAPHHGVHARDDVRWSIWEKIPRSTHARLAQQLPSVAFCLAGVPFGDCVARARDYTSLARLVQLRQPSASANLPKHCAPAFSAHDHYTEQFSVACIRGHTWATPSLADAT